MTALIVLLVIVAFIAARMMRSTRIWWTCIIAIMAGLLVGITSKSIISDSDDELTVITTDFNNSQYLYMQSALTDFNDDEVAGHTNIEPIIYIGKYNSIPAERTYQPRIPEWIDDS